MKFLNRKFILELNFYFYNEFFFNVNIYLDNIILTNSS